MIGQMIRAFGADDVAWPGSSSRKLRFHMIAYIRKVQKSVPRWSQLGGRQAYLNFIDPYLP